MTANYTTIRKVNEFRGKTLNEPNCHLHPLDTIASSRRSPLKSLETAKGDLFAKDCVAGNLVLQVSKLRYKDGNWDPKGFKTFLQDNDMPKGIIPRYRGNRLHTLFHICGKLIHLHKTFLICFTTGKCGGLVSSIRKDFESKTGIMDIRKIAHRPLDAAFLYTCTVS